MLPGSFSLAGRTDRQALLQDFQSLIASMSRSSQTDACEEKSLLQHLHHSTQIVSVSVSSASVWSKMAACSFTPLDIHIHFVFEPHITQHYTHRNHHTWSLVIKYNSTLQKICPQHMLILNIHTAHRILIPTSLLRPVVPHFTCSCPSMKVCGVGSKTCFSLTINFYKPI